MSLLSTYLPRGMVAVGRIVIHETIANFSYPVDTFVLVCLVGGGGSGAAIRHGTGGGDYKLLAQGGNAGGVLYQLIRLKANVDYSITVGLGGVAQSSGTVSNSALDGNAGTSTIMTGTGLPTLTANGGLGGAAKRYVASGATTEAQMTLATQAQSGGSGADTIFEPGRGGRILGATAGMGANYTCAHATGGGAANILGIKYTLANGGEINMNPGTNAVGRTTAITGGGGCSGSGGRLNYNGVGTSYAATTGGGGSSGNATDYTPAAFGLAGVGGPGSSYFSATLQQLIGAGTDGQYTPSPMSYTSSGSGGGVGGLIYSSTVSTTEWAAGAYGGGGGSCFAASTTNDMYGISGGAGGGGGGAAIADSAGVMHGRVYSGAGGNGTAIIWLLSDFGKVKS